MTRARFLIGATALRTVPTWVFAIHRAAGRATATTV